MLRRLPVAVPGEGALRKAPSVRERERQRAMLRFGVLVAVIVLVGGGLWLASVRGRSSSNTGTTSPTAPPPALARVEPTSVAASSQSGARVADNVIDGKLGTFWSRLVPSEDAQPFLRFSFARPVDLGRVTIAAGASGAEFSKRPRPQEIELQFSDGTTLRAPVHLDGDRAQGGRGQHDEAVVVDRQVPGLGQARELLAGNAPALGPATGLHDPQQLRPLLGREAPDGDGHLRRLPRRVARRRTRNRHGALGRA